jgi:flavin-dependent dehydrogenase
MTNNAPVEIDAQAVICANGASRGFAAKNHNELDDRVLLACRGYFDNVELPHRSYEVYYLDYLPVHYVWVFPLPGGMANVGLIMRVGALRARKERVDLVLDRFVTKQRLEGGSLARARRVSQVRTALLKTALQPGRLCESGLFFVGDAAAMANPLTGEGIGPAMVSARLAVDALVSAWNDGSPRWELSRSYEEAIVLRYGQSFDMANRMFTQRHSLVELALPTSQR